MSDREAGKIVSFESHLLNRRYKKAFEAMERYIPPWKHALRPGACYITIDSEGMVYGRLVRFVGQLENSLGLPSLVAVSRHYTVDQPEGPEEEIFVAQVWGLLTEDQFARARELGWPRSRGRFLDLVVTDDPRYAVLFHPADWD